MDTALSKIEPIPLPDQRRPTRMPSLPGWVTSRVGALAENLQPDPATRSYRDVTVLPAGLMPTTAQRVEMHRHIASLRSLLEEQTPAASENAEKATLVIVTKMLLVLPGQQTS